jgi:hypothetical protein
MIPIGPIPSWLFAVAAAPIVGSLLFTLLYAAKLICIPQPTTRRDVFVLVWGVVFAPACYLAAYLAAVLLDAGNSRSTVMFFIIVFSLSLPGLLTTCLLRAATGSRPITVVACIASLIPLILSTIGELILIVGPVLWLVMVLPTMLLCKWSTRGRFKLGRCSTCGYDISGVVSALCPECGTMISTRLPEPLALPRADAV